MATVFFKHDPLHVLGAGRRGERAVVHEVFFDGLWKQSQQRKRFQRAAFTFKTSMFVFLLLQFEIMKSFVDVIFKKRITKPAHAVYPFNDGCIVLVVFNAGLRNRPSLGHYDKRVADMS